MENGGSIVKNMKCVIATALFVAIYFCMTSCGKQQYDYTKIYRISKVVEETEYGEIIYYAEYDDAGKPLRYKATQDGEEVIAVDLRYRGNAVEIYEQVEDGDDWFLMEIRYNSGNQIISQRSRYTEELYSYNGNGDLTSYQEVCDDEIQCSWEYENTYNQSGQLEKVEITKVNDVNGFEEYTYDSKGNIISKMVGSLFGEIRQEVVRYEWAYDDNGNVLTEALYDIYDEEYVYRREYSYISCDVLENQAEDVMEPVKISSLFSRDGWWDITPGKMCGSW